MFTLLFLTGLGVWGFLGAMFLLFCILAALVENEKGFASFLVFLGMAGLFLFGTEPSGLTFAKENLLWVGIFGASYLVGALVYSVLRWKYFTGLITRSYKSIRDAYVSKNGIADGEMTDEHLLAFRKLCTRIGHDDYDVRNYAEDIGSSRNYQKYLKFDAQGVRLKTAFSDHYRRLILWATYWPAAFLGNVLYDFARHVVEEIVLRCRRIFEMISDRELAKYSNDLRDIPPTTPSTPTAGSGPSGGETTDQGQVEFFGGRSASRSGSSPYAAPAASATDRSRTRRGPGSEE